MQNYLYTYIPETYSANKTKALRPRETRHRNSAFTYASRCWNLENAQMNVLYIEKLWQSSQAKPTVDWLSRRTCSLRPATSLRCIVVVNGLIAAAGSMAGSGPLLGQQASQGSRLAAAMRYYGAASNALGKVNNWLLCASLQWYFVVKRTPVLVCTDRQQRRIDCSLAEVCRHVSMYVLCAPSKPKHRNSVIILHAPREN